MNMRLVISREQNGSHWAKLNIGMQSLKGIKRLSLIAALDTGAWLQTPSCVVLDSRTATILMAEFSTGTKMLSKEFQKSDLN